jgi:hypothetical protein
VFVLVAAVKSSANLRTCGPGVDRHADVLISFSAEASFDGAVSHTNQRVRPLACPAST